MDTESVKRKIDEAVTIGTELSREKPQISTLPMVLEQLLYLKEIYDREKGFRSVPKGKLTMGVIAAKDSYDVVHPKFANLLYDIDYSLDHPD